MIHDEEWPQENNSVIVSIIKPCFYKSRKLCIVTETLLQNTYSIKSGLKYCRHRWLVLGSIIIRIYSTKCVCSELRLQCGFVKQHGGLMPGPPGIHNVFDIELGFVCCVLRNFLTVVFCLFTCCFVFVFFMFHYAHRIRSQCTVRCCCRPGFSRRWHR